MIDYNLIARQVAALGDADDNGVGLLANAAALLKEAGAWHWVGFYLVDKELNCLRLGPFQGPLACTRIPYGKGVCGTAWQRAETVVVDDVDVFPGHIACSSLSRSEIVVPVFCDNAVFAVLDIDSAELNTFSEDDRTGLELVCKALEQAWKNMKVMNRVS